MSLWRILVKAIHDKGGACCAADLRPLVVVDNHAISGELTRAKWLGLVTVENIGTANPTWRLTGLGRDWCEGRVTLVRTNPGGRRWVSTWLASLPRGIRLQAEQPQECQAA